MRALDLASKSSISSLPAILVLRNTKVHVHISYGSNMASYIETVIDYSFSKHTAFWIPNINPKIAISDLDDTWIMYSFDTM